jgi:hypothetical protein
MNRLAFVDDESIHLQPSIMRLGVPLNGLDQPLDGLLA